MPIFKEIKEEKLHILIWEYREQDRLEEENLLEEEVLKTYHKKRQRELLMVRKMLKTILPNTQLYYNEEGKPYLVDKHISISHSFPYAVLAISEDKIGVDLEKVATKIQNLKERFLYKTEWDWVKGKENEAEILTIIWTIKEVLYKLHTPQYWSFREHYEVKEFNLSDTKEIKCSVIDENGITEYKARTIKIEDNFYLTIVI